MITRAALVAAITGGTVHGPDVEIQGAAIDSRVVTGGELFVPVVAERDGHDFIPAALDAGAAAYLTSSDAGSGPGTSVNVESTVVALAELGRWARGRLPRAVVGITGSTGKTSTKDMLGAVLSQSRRCVVSARSFNNDLGVPLTLFNAPDDTEVAVIEMGARALGDIRRLCGVARPSVGVVTNVGMSHIATLGSPEGVAQVKSELVKELPESGVAVLNADDPAVAAMASMCAGRVVTFGVDNGDVRAVDVAVDDHLRPCFRLVSPWGEAAVRLEVRGEHHVANAAAAACAALVLGAGLDEVAAGLGEATLSPWRMAVTRTGAGAVVLNDAYNANPMSTEAALRALARIDARRRIAVLGPMLELGDHSTGEHRRIGDLARGLGIDTLITVSAPGYGGHDVADPAAAAESIGAVGEGDAVLVKASRAAGLERLVALLVGDDGDAPW